MDPTEHALLSSIARDPDDVASAAVLSDLLTARDDPRGEFIALQLLNARGEATPKQQARESALFQKHWKVWVGPLAPLLYRNDTTFKHGFLSKTTVNAESMPKLKKVIGDPTWRTVRELSLCSAQGQVGVEALVRDPTCGNLKGLLGIDEVQLGSLATSKEPLGLISMDAAFSKVTEEKLARAFLEGNALPHLTQLGLEPDFGGDNSETPFTRYEWLFRSERFSSIRTLRTGYLNPLHQLVERLMRTELLEVHHYKYWETRLGRQPWGAHFRWSRPNATDPFAALEVFWDKPWSVFYVDHDMDHLKHKLADVAKGNTLRSLTVRLPLGNVYPPTDGVSAFDCAALRVWLGPRFPLLTHCVVEDVA